MNSFASLLGKTWPEQAGKKICINDLFDLLLFLCHLLNSVDVSCGYLKAEESAFFYIPDKSTES